LKRRRIWWIIIPVVAACAVIGGGAIYIGYFMSGFGACETVVRTSISMTRPDAGTVASRLVFLLFEFDLTGFSFGCLDCQRNRRVGYDRRFRFARQAVLT
jgi:hypothetical protein